MTKQLPEEARAALREALRQDPDVLRATWRTDQRQVVLALAEVAEDLEAYKERIGELMRVVASTLGPHARGVSLACGPAASVAAAEEGGTVVYEREQS